MPLTDTKLRNLKPTGTRFELPDRNGLVLRVSARGAMTWTVAYRVRGEGEAAGERVARLAGDKRRATLGDYPTLSLAEARARAAEIKRLARAGLDPVAAQRDTGRPSGPIVADLVERYAAEHLKRNGLRAGANAEKQLRLHVLPAWGTRPVAAVERRDLVQLIEDVRIPRTRELRGDGERVLRVTRGGPGAAAEVRKWTRAMFQFAVDTGLRADNPFTDVRNRDRQRRRDRVLSMEELRAVWEAAGLMGYPWGPCYRLILLTGDRRGEWARARAVLASLPREGADGGAGPFLFSTGGGARPVSGFSKAKARLDRFLANELGRPLASWVVHDLRRSMATHMERIGVEPHVIEVCLGHVLKGVAGTYRQYGYLPEKARALQAWAHELLRGVREEAESATSGAVSLARAAKVESTERA
jgi:integrase